MNNHSDSFEKTYHPSAKRHTALWITFRDHQKHNDFNSMKNKPELINHKTGGELLISKDFFMPEIKLSTGKWPFLRTALKNPVWVEKNACNPMKKQAQYDKGSGTP